MIETLVEEPLLLMAAILALGGLILGCGALVLARHVRGPKRGRG